MPDNDVHHLAVLRDRERYLAARIAAKDSVGWETLYDLRERAALLWAIAILQKGSGDAIQP